jgi:hypothetical protein
MGAQAHMNTATPYANSEQVLFCWLRESAPGRLECDLGLPVERSDVALAALGLHPLQHPPAVAPVKLSQVIAALSSEDAFRALPEWARKSLSALLGPVHSDEQAAAAKAHCDIVLAAADRALSTAPASSCCELHLPYIARRGWPSRFEILDRASFRFAQGRVAPSSLAAPPDAHAYNAVLLAAGAMSAAAGVELRHSFTSNLPPSVLAPLLDLAFGSHVQCTAAPGDATISQSLAPAALAAWRRAPGEKSPAYFPVHAAVSVALQNAFRRWIPLLWLNDPARWEDTGATQAILAYAASRPFPGRRRTDFTWDLLSPDWVYGAFRLARRGLNARLRSMRQAVLNAGKMSLAEEYRPAHSKEILARVRKQKKAVRDIFAAEGEIVNHVLQFGVTLRTADSAFELAHEAPEFAAGLATRLRRVSKDVDLTPLATMVMMEAANALHAALGGENQLRTRFALTSKEALESLAA